MNIVPEKYRLKIALDTQILSYLLDETYPQLNDLISFLGDSSYVDLKCSGFSIYEFIEIRKREHYFREVVNVSRNNSTKVNFSSLLKYKNSWSAPELDYYNNYLKIKVAVEDDINKIYDDFNIDFETTQLHSQLWGPHKDLVLTSKISKEDSLVLLSNAYPDNEDLEEYLILLSNDEGFVTDYNKGLEESSCMKNVFLFNDITPPHCYKLADIRTPITGTPFNIKVTENNSLSLKDFCQKFIIEHIELQCAQNGLLLGKIIPCAARRELIDELKLLCFNLKKKELNNNLYLSVIPKDLSKMELLHSRVSNFHNQETEITTYPYIPNEGDSEAKGISVSLHDLISTTDDFDRIKVPGNLLLIHPDN